MAETASQPPADSRTQQQRLIDVSDQVTASSEVQFVTDGGDPWFAPIDLLTKLEDTYPNVDLLGTCRQAALWLEASPSRRKTTRGMPRFLAGWFAKAKTIERRHDAMPEWLQDPDVQAWAMPLRVAGAKIGPGNWPVWEGLVRTHGAETVSQALRRVKSSERWPDAIEDLISRPGAHSVQSRPILDDEIEEIVL